MGLVVLGVWLRFSGVTTYYTAQRIINKLGRSRG
jgi:hypothetical protein